MQDEAPLCSNCGARCNNGFEYRYSDPERDTGASDEWFLCDICLEEEGRWDAADAAYDLEVEDSIGE